MRQFKRKWTLDRQKFLSEAEVKKLRRVTVFKFAGICERLYNVTLTDQKAFFPTEQFYLSIRYSFESHLFH